MAQIYENLVSKFQLQHLNISYGTVSHPEGEEKSAINDKLIKLIEEAREQFETGFPALGIPPLEPVEIEHVNFFLYQKGIIRAPVNVYDIEIAGLKEFVIDDLNFQMSDLTLNFDITIPELILTSRYTVNGKVGSVIPFRPKGNARIEMSNIIVKGVANLKTSNKSLKVRAFQISLDVAKTKVHFSGLLGNGLANKIVNWVLNRLSDRVVQAQKDSLADSAATEIMDMANSILKSVTLMDLIGG